MSYGYGVGDFLAVSTLALRVYKAYKDAPGDYRHISEEVKSLHIMIEEGVHHLESTTLSCSQQQKGNEILQGCHSVLEDLSAFINKYKSLVFANKHQVVTRVKLGMEDMTTLRTRLISNTILLNGFIQRFVGPPMGAWKIYPVNMWLMILTFFTIGFSQVAPKLKSKIRKQEWRTPN